MSKSDPSPYSRIHISDDADTITLKIRKAKTDPYPLGGEPKDFKERPEALNLLNIYSSLAGISVDKACQQFEGKTFSTLKTELTDLLISTLDPIRQKKEELMKDISYLDSLLKRGSLTAFDLAQRTLKDVKNIIGFLQT